MVFRSAARPDRVLLRAASCVVLLLAQARSQTCKLNLKVISANGVKHNDGGGFIGFGKPDAFVIVKQSGREVCKTSHKGDTEKPVWNHQCPNGISNVQLGKAALAFEVWDHDGSIWPASDDLVASTAATLTSTRLCSQGYMTGALNSFNNPDGKSDDVNTLTVKYCYDCPTLKCPTNYFAQSGRCAICSNSNCASGKYRSGSCGSTTNGFQCNSCSNQNCASGKYRSGSCGGITNGFQCNSCSNQNCASGKYRSGSCSGITNGFQCKSCNNVKCAASEYQTGTCGGTTNANTLQCTRCSNPVYGSALCPPDQRVSSVCNQATKKLTCTDCANKACRSGQTRQGTCDQQTGKGLTCVATTTTPLTTPPSTTPSPPAPTAPSPTPTVSPTRPPDTAHATTTPPTTSAATASSPTTRATAAIILPTTKPTPTTNSIPDVRNVQCGVNQYRKGSAPGECYTCSNVVCPNGQQRTGDCGGATDGWACTDTSGTSTNTNTSATTRPPPPPPLVSGTSETKPKATRIPPNTQGTHVLLCVCHADTSC